MVMYLGQIVEIGPADVILQQPRHPYTAGAAGLDALAWIRDTARRKRR